MPLHNGMTGFWIGLYEFDSGIAHRELSYLNALKQREQ